MQKGRGAVWKAHGFTVHVSSTCSSTQSQAHKHRRPASCAVPKCCVSDVKHSSPLTLQSIDAQIFMEPPYMAMSIPLQSSGPPAGADPTVISSPTTKPRDCTFSPRCRPKIARVQPTSMRPPWRQLQSCTSNPQTTNLRSRAALGAHESAHRIAFDATHSAGSSRPHHPAAVHAQASMAIPGKPPVSSCSPSSLIGCTSVCRENVRDLQSLVSDQIPSL